MSALAAQLFRDVRPDFFGVLARPSARLYVDSLDALEYEAVQRNQGLDREEALALVEGEPEVMVCGGAEVYALGMEVADRLYVTEVAAEVDGDVFFPEYDKKGWREVSREKHAEEGLSYDWVVYER